MKTGKYYWLIPFIFVGIFTEIGLIVLSHLRPIAISINGNLVLYIFPKNYVLWYNTSTGPLSSIFLANFIWDGWENTLLFMIYATTFVIAIALSPHRIRIALFSVVGAIFVGTLDMVITRLFLPVGVITYGQSAILAGFAGIVMFFTIRESIHLYRSRWKNLEDILIKYKHSEAMFLSYVVIYTFFIVVATCLLYSFISPTLSKITIEIHVNGLILGIVFAGVFTLLTEARLGKKEEINIESESIFNFEGAQE